MNMFEGIKAGDNVIFNDSFGGYHPVVKKVSAITSTGNLKVLLNPENGFEKIFTKEDGRERGGSSSGFRRDSIQPFSQKIMDDYAAKKAKDKLAVELKDRAKKMTENIYYMGKDKLDRLAVFLKDVGY